MATPVRELLAVVLGVALGLVMIAYPQLLVRLHVVGRTPRTPGPGGPEGAETDEKWLWLVRLLGVACLGVAGVIGAGLLT